MKNPKTLKDKISLAAILLAAALVCLALNPVSCIGEGRRGVLYIFGKASETIIEPGINFKPPVIGKIKSWSIKPHTYDLEINIEERGAVSKDNQIIGAEGKIVWNLDGSKLYQFVSRYEGDIANIEGIIKNTSYEALKSVIGEYSIYDLPGSMNTIGSKAYNNLKAKLDQYPIEITQFNIVNFDWSGDFDKRINDTMAAQQKVKEMEQQAAITEQQSKQQVIQAEARARALVAEAEGELQAAELNARARLVSATAEAEANRLKATPVAMEYQRALWAYEVQMERAKHLAPGVEVPMYIPLAPNGTAAVLTGR